MKYTDIAKAALVLVLGVMTSTVFADYLHEETFEGYTVDSAITNQAKWKGGTDDVSKVVVTNTYTGTKLLPDPHTKTLQLNTEGGVLTNTLALAADFQTVNVWVDALVKFVPSEDLPDLGADQEIKVAVYAYVKETNAVPLMTVTNLAIYHGVYNKLGSPSFYKTNTVTSIPVDPSAWYRLTIQLANGSGDNTMQACKISINGVPITSTLAYGDDWVDVVNVSPGTANGGTWFLSAGWEGTIVPKSVASLQFKGTGFIDDLVVTATDPFATSGPTTYPVTQNVGLNGSGNNPNTSFTVNIGSTTSLTYTAAQYYEIEALSTNGASIVGAIGQPSYTILVSSSNDVVVSFKHSVYAVTQNVGANGSGNNPNSSFNVNAGSTTSLTYTANEFYRIATLTTNGSTVSDAIGDASATIVVSSANTIAVTFEIVSGYGYTADNVSWFQDNGWGENDIVANALSFETLQMLNVAATNATAGGTISIEAIEVVGADVKVTVFIDRTMSLGANINGTLKLFGADTLAGGFLEIGTGITIGSDQDVSQDDIRKEITYLMAGGKKFYKAVIE